MAAAAKVFGTMLVETGQALQRSGRRALGETVLMPQPFKTVGVRLPFVASGAEIDPSSTIIGNVQISANTLVGEGTVIRADTNHISIGLNVDIGKNVIITAAQNKAKTSSGLSTAVNIGRDAVICDGTVIEPSVICNGAKLGAGCVIGEGSLIEAGAVLQPGTVVLAGHRIPANQIWEGNPAKFVSDVQNDH